MKQNEIWLINLDPIIGSEISKIGELDHAVMEEIRFGLSKVLSID